MKRASRNRATANVVETPTVETPVRPSTETID